MIFHILIAQRKCSYPGQYAPEALEVADDNTMDENPLWMAGKVNGYEDSKEFSSVKIMRVYVNDIAVEGCLFPPQQQIIDGEALISSA